MIVVNQVRCLKCGDTPFSAHVHDFKYCKCGNIAVDGGQDYLRRVGNLDNSYEEMSFSLPDEVVKRCKDAVQWGLESNRNELGIAFAMLRELKNSGVLNVEGVAK